MWNTLEFAANHCTVLCQLSDFHSKSMAAQQSRRPVTRREARECKKPALDSQATGCASGSVTGRDGAVGRGRSGGSAQHLPGMASVTIGAEQHHQEHVTYRRQPVARVLTFFDCAHLGFFELVMTVFFIVCWGNTFGTCPPSETPPPPLILSAAQMLDILATAVAVEH